MPVWCSTPAWKALALNVALLMLTVFFFSLSHLDTDLRPALILNEDFLYSDAGELRDQGWYTWYSPYENDSLFTISGDAITLENDETYGDSWFYFYVEDRNISRWMVKAKGAWTGKRQPFPLILGRTDRHLYIFAFYGGDDPCFHLWIDYEPINSFVAFKLTANVSFTFSLEFDGSVVNMYCDGKIVGNHELGDADSSNLKDFGFGTAWNSETRFDNVSLYELELGRSWFQLIDENIRAIGSVLALSVVYGLAAVYTLFKVKGIGSALFVLPVVLCGALWYLSMQEHFAIIAFIAGSMIAVGLFVKRETEKPESKLSNQQLKEQANELARDISRYVSDQRKNEPEIHFDEWKDSTSRYISYWRTTIDDYYTRFGSRVSMLREEFLARGIKDQEFETLWAHPTNPISLQMLSLRLATMAARL